MRSCSESKIGYTLHKNGTIIFNNLYLDRKEIL